MHIRHIDRQIYFSELSYTSEKYILPYINSFIQINADLDILEVGCGEGGNLMPFALHGCNITGIDISKNRIIEANSFFKNSGLNYQFIESDIFAYNFNYRRYDLIICHDVLEHIINKRLFLELLRNILKKDGYIFVAFPPWQMPFGGHQQICRNVIISKLPFIHLFPKFIYESILRFCNENVEDILRIRSTRITIEAFDELIKSTCFKIVNSSLWLINPHYEIKFGLRPLRVFKSFAMLKFIRNFYTTSYWSILRVN